jgi:2-(1,2-epoxy-1,2-dihydrophenyl)acetyl-CoA isomerase
MENDTVLFETRDAIATLTLNRPQRLNAIVAPMRQRLGECLAQIESDPSVRVVLLTGAGRGFCAGQDLNERRADEQPDITRSLRANYNPLIMRLRNLRVPSVCAVNGIAAGAGASLALNCDIVVAAQSASFLQAFARIGLAPDCGSTYLLPRLAGSARAAGMALLAESISSEQAERWGLIWRCVADADLAVAARELAARLAQLPPRALAGIKRALNASLSNSLQRQLDLEAEIQGELGTSEDYREGVRAFLDKRPALFTGR